MSPEGGLGLTVSVTTPASGQFGNDRVALQRIGKGHIEED
jgi:hypothetical protein